MAECPPADGQEEAHPEGLSGEAFQLLRPRMSRAAVAPDTPKHDDTGRSNLAALRCSSAGTRGAMYTDV